MWIRAPKEPHEEAMETAVVRAAIMYHTAIHADPISLRGITFIIDTSNKSAKQRRPTNDKKLQKTWQAMPLRPQTVLIAGASYLIINTLIMITSIFSKKKC